MKSNFEGYLLVSDMDGTLLRGDHTISEKNKQALHCFTQNGGKFTVATGRMVDAVRAYMPDLPINAPAILHNGAKIYDYAAERTLFEKAIEENRKDAIRKAHDMFPELGIEIYSEEVVYVYKKCEETKRFLNRDYKVVYGMPDEVWDKPWIKVLLIGEKALLDRYEPVYRTELDSGYAVRSGDKFLDIVTNGVSKGDAMIRLAKNLNISPDKVIAVGDNMNDISMLTSAGISYAVENAEAAVKQITTHTAPSNNNDAIAYIIENI